MDKSFRRRILALTIWWCEGTKLRKDKRGKNSYLYSIEVTNTNPKIIKLFILFLINDLHVNKSRFKGRLQIHEGDNREDLELFWSQETGIPRKQFNKTIIREKGNKIGKSKGTVTFRLYDKILFTELEVLLNNELKDIIGE